MDKVIQPADDHADSENSLSEEDLESDAVIQDPSNSEDDSSILDMLEAYNSAKPPLGAHYMYESCQPYITFYLEDGTAKVRDSDSDSDFLSQLKEIVQAPLKVDEVYTRVKKDIFHAFHMLPISVNHGSQPVFLCTL